MDNEVTVQDLISLSYDQKPIEFQQAFDTLIASRIAAAVDNKKMEVAQTMFGDHPASEDYDESGLDQEETSDGEAA
jgi:hypothetical protein